MRGHGSMGEIEKNLLDEKFLLVEATFSKF
jgi:hypothetical protein